MLGINLGVLGINNMAYISSQINVGRCVVLSFDVKYTYTTNIGIYHLFNTKSQTYSKIRMFIKERHKGKYIQTLIALCELNWILLRNNINAYLI